jgi:hypothetical protein
VGDFSFARTGAALGRVEDLFHPSHDAYYDLWAFNSCRAFAERGGGGFGRRFRRGWQPNGLRPARRRDVSLEGYNLVRRHVHVDLHGDDHASKYGGGFYRHFGIAAILEVIFEKAWSSRSSGNARSSDTGSSHAERLNTGAGAIQVDRAG